MDLRHAYAEVNAIRLHYVAAGDGELMLFLHGFPEFWYEWKAQLEDFGRDHLAVAPDLRGYNLSSKPPDVEHYRMHLLVEDITGLADHLGRERFVLVGHDWGGVVAWAFALAHPERLHALIIVNAPHPAIFQRELRSNPAQQRASRYMLTMRDPHAEEQLAANDYAQLAAGLFPLTDEERAAYVAAWSQPGALTGGLNYYRAMRTGPDVHDTAESAQRLAADAAARVVTVPTLVIWGEQDRFLLTSNLDGLEQYVPDLSVKRIPDGSHWVIHEQPTLVDNLMRTFLASLAARGGPSAPTDPRTDPGTNHTG